MEQVFIKYQLQHEDFLLLPLHTKRIFTAVESCDREYCGTQMNGWARLNMLLISFGTGAAKCGQEHLNVVLLLLLNMELERMYPHAALAAREEESRNDGRRCCAWLNCDKVHETVSKWMLPEDSRSTYLERANCIPPPIFIIAVSIAEVGGIWVERLRYFPLFLSI